MTNMTNNNFWYAKQWWMAEQEAKKETYYKNTILFPEQTVAIIQNIHILNSLHSFSHPMHWSNIVIKGISAYKIFFDMFWISKSYFMNVFIVFNVFSILWNILSFKFKFLAPITPYLLRFTTKTLRLWTIFLQRKHATWNFWTGFARCYFLYFVISRNFDVLKIIQ